MQDTIAVYQPKANAATDPDEKIKYLHVILDALYEYKIKYADKGVNVIEQDVEELIDDILDAISEARL